jgi:hypothetical protein
LYDSVVEKHAGDGVGDAAGLALGDRLGDTLGDGDGTKPATQTWPTHEAVADAKPQVAGSLPLLQLDVPPLGAVRKPPPPVKE